MFIHYRAVRSISILEISDMCSKHAALDARAVRIVFTGVVQVHI